MSTNTPHDCLMGETYEVNGEKRTNWTNIGVAFPLSSGGFNVRLSAFPINGEFVIKERKAKKDSK